MSERERPIVADDFNGQIIELEPNGKLKRPKRGRWVLIIAFVVCLFALSRAASIYVETLWFGSLGYSSVYWTTFKYEIALFVGFTLATLFVLRGAFWSMERAFDVSALAPRRFLLNNQTVIFKPARVLKPLAWIIALVFSFGYGASMSGAWQTFALWLNHPATTDTEPIFGRQIAFYLFTLPVAEILTAWFSMLAFIILCGAVVYALLSLIPSDGGGDAQQVQSSNASPFFASARRAAYASVSFAFAAFLVALALRVYFSRFANLFDNHQIFSGVTYTEDHYLLPGLIVVAIALLIAAGIALVNAFALRRLRPLLVALALPLATYLVAVVLIPGYVQSFIVKPNELDRETPYIEHNIAATRRAFNLERIEARDFPADTSNESYALMQNRLTLDNLRLWDYHALQDTLRQVQEIRTYYDFHDVDVDRYKIGEQTKQVMVAARELDVSKLPASSRGNWINERLIYTHGYGVTMNTANGFTPEGRPQFVLSNMPTESSVPEIKLIRPQIYFGEKTDTTVYVNTKQKEFDYPQGDANASTVYEGASGFQMGNAFRRFVLAWELDDLSRLPFSDDVTSESRVLMRRNINERLHTLAPFLIYDSDPYIVVNRAGRLYWMIDAYTATNTYPYARHYDVGGNTINYIRNSVKATIDAYDGSVVFYIFDDKDSILRAYRNLFPTLFRDAANMPEDLRAHIRYPETLLKAQADAYSLYHTDNPKVLFQREDMWSVARETAPKNNQNNSTTDARPLEPYFALLQLPGKASNEQSATTEFVNVIAFTPASRDNLIGWMAGRSDGDAYGSLLVYKFPKSKLVNGPLQVNARIDQNAQLSSQLTLWNQQGSRVQRGNLLIIPLGSGLLYVEPVYLQAERSPMPELRLVVLATQEKLAYGTNFAEALTALFGDSAGISLPRATNETNAQTPSTQTSNSTLNVTELIKRAAADLTDYQRLTAEGKLGEAGQRLESLKRELEELQKAKQ